MENLDYDSQQRRETFALYGLAMYHAQCFEKSLVIVVSAAYNKEYFKSDSNEEKNYSVVHLKQLPDNWYQNLRKW